MTDTSANFAKTTDAKGSTFDRAVRRLFPSTSLLTFNPLFRTIINAFDIVPRLIWSEFRDLPPNHLRVRIGVGNRIINNQVHFLTHARDFWMFVFTQRLADAQTRTSWTSVPDADAGRIGCATTIFAGAASPATYVGDRY